MSPPDLTPDRPSVMVPVRWPATLLLAVDKARGTVARSEWLREAAVEKMERENTKQGGKE